MIKLVVTDREGQVLSVDAHAGISVMENIRELDNSVEAICGGLCACATCHVYIDPDWFPRLQSPAGEEQDLLQSLTGFNEARSRLSCQVEVSAELDGMALTIGPEE